MRKGTRRLQASTLPVQLICKNSACYRFQNTFKKRVTWWGPDTRIEAASEHLFWIKLGKFNSSFTFQLFTLSQGACGQASRNINCKTQSLYSCGLWNRGNTTKQFVFSVVPVRTWLLPVHVLEDVHSNEIWVFYGWMCD